MNSQTELELERSRLDAIGLYGLSLIKNEQRTKSGWMSWWQIDFVHDGVNLSVIGDDLRRALDDVISIKLFGLNE